MCWPTKEGVHGQYMVCLLYQDVLCLASAGKADQIYTIQLCVELSSLKVEEVDDGRGAFELYPSWPARRVQMLSTNANAI